LVVFEGLLSRETVLCDTLLTDGSLTKAQMKWISHWVSAYLAVDRRFYDHDLPCLRLRLVIQGVLHMYLVYHVHDLTVIGLKT